MPAYLIVRIEVTDPEAYKEYTAQTPALVKAAGGRFIVRGGETDTFEGPEENRRIVVIEYPSMEIAKAFYNSPEYQAILPIRLNTTISEAVLVDGA